MRLPLHVLGGLVLVLALVVGGLAPSPAQAALTTLDFENGADGAVIGATIPGVQFSNSAGFDWTYGDIRTGRYNAPYPANCPDFGGQCAYAVSGNVFAWMGEAAGVGRIDFIDATTTFVSAGFSTADTLTVSAYSAAGALLATQTIDPNLRTGRLDRASLTAPAGGNIAYVLISGGSNRWLMDDLTTDATVSAPVEDRTRTALVTAVQRPSPSVSAAPGGVVTVVIEVANRGRGRASNATITLATDPALLAVLDARFSRSGAWVSSLTPQTIVIQTGALAARTDVITITLRLRVLPEAPAGAALGARASFTWRDGVNGGAGRSNLPVLVVGAADQDAPTLPLAITGGAGSLTYTSAIFAPFEPVGVWYNTPDGRAVAVATLRADLNGQVSGLLSTAGLAPGSYSLVAAGEWSLLTSVGIFEVGGAGSGS